MLLLYNFFLTIFSPFWIAWMLFRTYQRREKPIWGERFGNYPFEHRKDRKRIWIHAVSVGEVMASLPVLKEVKSLLPDYDLILSTTTSSGHTTAKERATGIYDYLVYFPIDVPRFMLAAMQRAQPSVVATIDTELWMNFIWAAKTFRSSALLINGRISDRSFPRARMLKPFYAALLADMDRCLMQTSLDAERIRALGGNHVEVLGNVKFDQAIEHATRSCSEWKSELGIPTDRPAVVIGSTRGEREEKFVLAALKTVGFERVAVVHAPRHLERVPELAKFVEGATGRVALRSKRESGPYVILDTYGELSQVYAIADFVIVGGGFGRLGGQNIIQPLAKGKPVIHGSHMENFRDVAAMSVAAGASRVAKNPSELAAIMNELLADPQMAANMGEAARALVMANVGASKRYASEIAAAAAESKAQVVR